MPWVKFIGGANPTDNATVLEAALDRGSILPNQLSAAKSLLVKFKSFRDASTGKRLYVTPSELEVWCNLPGWEPNVSDYGPEPLVFGGITYAEYPGYAKFEELPEPRGELPLS